MRSLYRRRRSVELEVKVCEEVKKEHIQMQFRNVIVIIYFHKNDPRIASECIDFDLSGEKNLGVGYT